VRDSSDMGDNASNIDSDDNKLSMATEAEDICQVQGCSTVGSEGKVVSDTVRYGLDIHNRFVQ